jgi:hypothetical protein
VKNAEMMKIPGGTRKGVNIFLSINICQFPLLIRALIFRQDYGIIKDIILFVRLVSMINIPIKDIFTIPAGGWNPRKNQVNPVRKHFGL